MYGLIAIQKLAGTGLFEQVAQRRHVSQLLFVFGGAFTEFVEVDSEHGGVAAVVDLVGIRGCERAAGAERFARPGAADECSVG